MRWVDCRGWLLELELANSHHRRRTEPRLLCAPAAGGRRRRCFSMCFSRFFCVFLCGSLSLITALLASLGARSCARCSRCSVSMLGAQCSVLGVGVVSRCGVLLSASAFRDFQNTDIAHPGAIYTHVMPVLWRRDTLRGYLAAFFIIFHHHQAPSLLSSIVTLVIRHSLSLSLVGPMVGPSRVSISHFSRDPRLAPDPRLLATSD